MISVTSIDGIVVGRPHPQLPRVRGWWSAHSKLPADTKWVGI